MGSYAKVEWSLALLLQSLLGVDLPKAHAIFFAIQNTRSRNELFQSLLAQEFNGELKKYWASCSKFLLKLAKFRNAIAHWHPHVSLYENAASELIIRPALRSPIPRSDFHSIEIENFDDFHIDCQHIADEIIELFGVVVERPSAWPQKFLNPITHRNLAVLKQPHTPKVRQPRRPPSVPKLSAAQKRAKALKDARIRAKQKP